MVCGLTLAVFGREVFRLVAFPLIFLAAMVPLPASIYGQVADWMRWTATWGSVTLAQALGVTIFRDGYDVYLPTIQLHVGLSCSGIRYLVSYLVFGAAYAFLFKKSTKARLLTVLAVLPLSVAASVMRLSVIFGSVYHIGPYLAEHRPHVVLSWSVFMVFLLGAIGADQYLSRTTAVRREQP